MSDVNYSLVIVSGAPVVTGCNKSFYLDDTTATGKNRVWKTTGSQRIYWNASNGWCIEDLNGSATDNTIQPTLFFYSNTEVDYANPWDVTTWITSIEAYQSYNPIVIGSSDPEITTETVTVSDYVYALNTDTKVLVGKTYYYKSGDKYLPADTVTLGKSVPENNYYVYDESVYKLFEQYREDQAEKGIDVPVTFVDSLVYYTRCYTGVSTSPYSYVKVLFAGNDFTDNEQIYVNTGNKVVKTITTTTNHRTGSTTQNIVETTVSTSESLTLHDRYTIPQIETGKIYRFSFVNDFKQLGYISPTNLDYNDGDEAENDSDITRGIYEVQAVTTYYDMVLGGIDVYQNLYLPLGIPKTVFEEDKTKWMSSDVWYKLVNPMLAAQVYYVPTSIIDGIPDGNVTPYDRYQLVIDIGIFNDPDLLTDMVTCVNMLFKAHFGIPTAAQLASYDKVYLPNSYADWMEGQRQININDFMKDHKDQYFNTLFYTEYNNLKKNNDALQSKVETYEEMIGDLANQ